MWVQKAILAAAVLLAFGVLGGLVVRRRVGVCWTFALYLATVLAADLLILLWPGQFYRQWFWLGKELLLHVLRFALALELTYRTFRAFPAARSTVRGVTLALLLATLGVVVSATGSLEPSLDAPFALSPLISRVQPRILNGTIWLLTGVAALILWYRLPVHPLHKAILTGFVPFLLVFTTTLSLLESHGWKAREWLNYLQTGAFLLLLGYWGVAAWRRGDVPVEAPEPEPALQRATG